MKIEELKKYTNNLNAYSGQEIENLEIMSNEELDYYQRELENDFGNLSEWDHLRVIITLRKLMWEK